MDFKQESEPRRRRIPEDAKFSVKRRIKTTKIVSRKILHRKHAKDGNRKKRVRKKKHSDSAIVRRKQKRQLQAAFKTIREYQSEASVRQSHPHVGHSQLDQNNFSERVPPTNPQLDFQPPMVRKGRVWASQPCSFERKPVQNRTDSTAEYGKSKIKSRHTESHPEAFSPRSLKHHYRRRKSHLEDVYRPNFEDFKDREYRKGRYVKWDQSGHRSSSLRSIKRTPVKKFEFSSNKSEKDISFRSALSSDTEKQYIYKNNCNEGCDSKRRSEILEKSNSTNNTSVSHEASTKKTLDGTMKKTPEPETQKNFNLGEIKQNSERNCKVLEHDSADLEKNSNSLIPVPFPSSLDVNYSSKVDKVDQSKQIFTQKLVAPDGDKITHPKTTNIDHITESNSSESFVKLVSCEKDEESDEETMPNDFISIDKIDTTKSFLECFPTDDYRVIDMDVDCPSPEKISKSGISNNLTGTQCNNVYPEINCDQLLNELNEAIEDDCNNKINNVDKEKTAEKTDCKSKLCSKNLTDERMKDAKSKCSKEHTKAKLEKPRCDKKNNAETRISPNNKMSSLFYPGLANYTIPKKNCEKKARFSDTDEPYMNKMQSLFGIEEENEDDQKLESMNDNKGDSKKYPKKRLSADEGHSQNKKRCTDTKTSRSSRGSAERHMKPSSKLVEEKSKSTKNSKRIADTSKTSISTNTTRCKVNEGKRKKTESTESLRLSKETGDSKNQRKQLTKTVRKSEAYNAKQVTEDTNAAEKKSCKKHLKIMDNKRRNSETPSSNTKVVTKRRHSLQLNSSTDVRQNEKLLEKSQTKNILNKISPQNDITKLLEKHSEKTNVPVKLICDTENPKLQAKNVSEESNPENDIVKLLKNHSEKTNVQVKRNCDTNKPKLRIEKVIAEHSAIDKSTISFTEEPLHSNECTTANSEPAILDNSVKQMKSKITDLDEISSALSKIFESETHIVKSAAEPMISSNKESTSEVTPNEICSVLKHLQEPLIEEKANNTKPLEIEETSSKCPNLDLDSTSSADEIGKATDSSSLVTPQQLDSFSKISNSNNNDEHKHAENPTDKVQDKIDNIDHEPILDSNDNKNILCILKVPLSVKTAVKSEFFLTDENCHPLSEISLPQFHRVKSYIVVSDYSEKATLVESPDINQSLGLIRNERFSAVDDNEEMLEEISDDDDTFDDVIEIKPNIPVIDLTKESSDVNTAKVDSKADLLELLEEGFDRREKITIYRSDETSNNSLEVQAMSASIPLNILRTNTSEGIVSDTAETIAKVEPDVVIEPCVIESNQNTDSTEDSVSTAFVHNVRGLVRQLENSDYQDDASAEISQIEETTEIVEIPVVETIQPAIENIRSESIIPDNSNEVLFIHPESVDHTSTKSTRRTNSRWNTSPNTPESNDIQTISVHITNQAVGRKENDVNPITKLTRFVYPNSPLRNVPENRLNEAQGMEPVVRNEESNQMIQFSTSGINMLEQAFGNRNLIHSIQQSPRRPDMNSNSIQNFQNAGTVQDPTVVCHLTQQEYLVSNAIVPYIHLMACIRKNLAEHSDSLKTNLYFLPELLKIELKLSEHIYMNKLQIYSGYIVNRLKSLDLSRNMTSVTAHAIIEYIFQTVAKVNKYFTKTSTILFLEHLMKPHESFFGVVPYLKPFYSLVKVFCMEIVRRGATSSDVSPCQQLTPDQRKILEYQIQQFHKILYTEKCKQLRNERLNREKNNQPGTSESTLFSLLNRPGQTNVSKNQLAAKEGQTISLTNNSHLPVALRSPAHRPEGFMNSPAHVTNETNIIPRNGVVFNYPANVTTSRSPAHRSEGILPQALSQRKSNNATFMPLSGSPAHRLEDRQLPATLRSPYHRPDELESPPCSMNNHNNTGTVHFPEMLRSPAHVREGIQQPVASSIVCGQSKTNNPTWMTAATIKSLVHKPPPQYGVHSNRNQLSNTSLNKLQCLTQNIPAHGPGAVLKSPAHRPESFSASSSPSHIPAALGSPVHRPDRAINSLARSSVAKSPAHQPGSLHTFAVPRKPPNKPKTVNSPPVSSLSHTSPSRSVCQNSPVYAHISTIPSMSPGHTFSMNVPLGDSSNEASPRTSNAAYSSPETPAAATPSRTAMPNLINIRSPVYAPMLFSPPNFVQDEPDDPLDVDEEGSHSGKDSANEDILETIDLTWLDDVDDEQIQKEIEFITVKKEEPDDEEVILNQEQFPVVPSPADSGIASPTHQEECSELVYLHRVCICEGPAIYLCKCRMVMYCSASCQSRDWKDHKIACLKYSRQK